MDIVERLKEDAAHHLDTAEYADGDPKNTINYRYYLNNFEAADEIERLREALKKAQCGCEAPCLHGRHCSSWIAQTALKEKE